MIYLHFITMDASKLGQIEMKLGEWLENTIDEWK